MSNQSMKLLFIHGAGGSKSKWRTLTSTFKESENIYLDLPGHGENESEQCQTIREYAEFISKSITENCIVVGHSMGGLIALELGLLNDNVKGVVLAASSFKLPVHPKIISSLAEGDFPESLFLASYAKNVNPKLLEEEKQELEASSTEIAKNDFQACDDYKTGEDALKQLKQPVLAILGTEDRLIPPTTEEELKTIKPDIQMAKIEDAGHYVALEKPEEFITRLKDFKESLEN